jgi:peptidoglycan/LPS O-acetylase OafA/YrhL
MPMKRIPELDGLRGLAALSILAFHSREKYFYPCWAGVDLFFVLSGYLITRVILDNGALEGFLFRFYARRGLRIWPIYYLSLALLVLTVALGINESALDDWPWFATYMQYIPRFWSPKSPAFPWYLCHTWTLALEEQFYLIWPAVVVLAGRRRVVPLAAGAIVLAVLARAYGLYPRLLPARCDGFALGGLLASLPANSRWLQASLAASGVGAVTLLAAGSWTFGGSTFLGPQPVWPGLCIFSLGVVFTSVVGFTVQYSGHRWLAPLRVRWLIYIGSISYFYCNRFDNHITV